MHTKPLPLRLGEDHSAEVLAWRYLGASRSRVHLVCALVLRDREGVGKIGLAYGREQTFCHDDNLAPYCSHAACSRTQIPWWRPGSLGPHKAAASRPLHGPETWLAHSSAMSKSSLISFRCTHTCVPGDCKYAPICVQASKRWQGGLIPCDKDRSCQVSGGCTLGMGPCFRRRAPGTVLGCEGKAPCCPGGVGTALGFWDTERLRAQAGGGLVLHAAPATVTRPVCALQFRGRRSPD